jgi:hypothetical protein
MGEEIAKDLIARWRAWADLAENNPGLDPSLSTGYATGMREAARDLEMAVES